MTQALSVQSEPVARPLIVLISPEGQRRHDPKQWAEKVSIGMVSLDPDMPAERRERAIAVRGKIVDMLFNAFRAVKTTTSAVELGQIVDLAMERLGKIFAPTPWAFSAGHPHIRAEFRRYITQNLASATDIALRTE